ncbi:hypothetical protein [Paraburkholderia sp.]|uniref:hypothetical protein n=1 Tax=Paraburkholderia sp. TaxID=1926495 RepID=UPI003C7B456D
MTDSVKEFLQELSQQTPEQPDYWSSCGQCQRNANRAEDLLETLVADTPIPMILFCPKCGTQHIDAVEAALVWTGGSAPEPSHEEVTWNNPPHRSHLCHACGAIWRPADVATVGVRYTQTAGERDNWPHIKRAAPASEVQAEHIADERTDALCDSSYCAGLQQGFTFGQQDDNEGLHKALAARDGYVTVLREARALLSASKPAAAQGWKLVPVDPTELMAVAPHAALVKFNPSTVMGHPVMEVARECYRAMLAASPAVPAQSGEPYAYEIGAPDRTQELVYPAYLERYATEEERALPRLALYATPQPSQTVQSREDVLEKAAALCDQLAGEFPGGAADLCAKTLRRFNEQLDERETRQ